MLVDQKIKRPQAKRFAGLFGLLFGLIGALGANLISVGAALAVPSFAQQTGQPCSACHVGAFGPQLKPYGRDFKLYGYQSADGKSKVLPIAVTIQSSYTRTNADQNPVPAPNFAPNNNVALDQASIYYAGKAPMGFGVFAQGTYDGVAKSFHVDNFDIKHASEATIFGRDSVVGFDFNNNPTVQDVWNSTPAWGFPYNSSPVGPGAAASTLSDGALGGQVIGSGVYGLWDDTLYAELTAYIPLERQFAGRIGEGTGAGSDRFEGPIPYGRIALVHDIGAAQTVEVGAYGLSAQRYPGGVVTNGTDRLTDFAVDANYQYLGTGENEISAHGVVITERQKLGASSVLLGTNLQNHLTTARADLSYSYQDTWTPSIQAFRTHGTDDPTLYGGGANTAGYVIELAYVPMGKPTSVPYWVNARIALQYVAYSQFNGDRKGASDNNTLYASLWIALAPFGSMVHR